MPILAAGAVFAAVLAAPSIASAYCQTSICNQDSVGFICDPATQADCGTPLRWPGGCTGFSVSSAGSVSLPASVVEPIVQQAFAAWTDADCGGGTPALSISNLGTVSCRDVEFNAELGNANVIVFRDEGWPYGGSNTLALTTVTFNLETGEIRDADMELNSAEVVFTTSDDDVQFDLLSVLTHEAGHFLGLSHSPAQEATMNADYTPKTIDLRDLSDDDVAGICATYPAGASTCDPTPRNGLSDLCSSEIEGEEGCCTVAPGRARSQDAPLRIGLVAVGLALLACRRRRRPERG